MQPSVEGMLTIDQLAEEINRPAQVLRNVMTALRQKGTDIKGQWIGRYKYFNADEVKALKEALNPARKQTKSSLQKRQDEAFRQLVEKKEEESRSQQNWKLSVWNECMGHYFVKAVCLTQREALEINDFLSMLDIRCKVSLMYKPSYIGDARKSACMFN